MAGFKKLLVSDWIPVIRSSPYQQLHQKGPTCTSIKFITCQFTASSPVCAFSTHLDSWIGPSTRLPSFNHSPFKSILCFIIGLIVHKYPFTIQSLPFDDCFIVCKKKELRHDVLSQPVCLLVCVLHLRCWQFLYTVCFFIFHSSFRKLHVKAHTSLFSSPLIIKDHSVCNLSRMCLFSYLCLIWFFKDRNS